MNWGVVKIWPRFKKKKKDMGREGETMMMEGSEFPYNLGPAGIGRIPST